MSTPTITPDAISDIFALPDFSEEDDLQCVGCPSESDACRIPPTWWMYMTPTCTCFPSRLPHCDYHKENQDAELRFAGNIGGRTVCQRCRAYVTFKSWHRIK